MINGVHKLLAAYYDCLEPGSFDVFQGSVPEEHKGDYVLIRAESENDRSNRHHFITRATVVLEIVTEHAQEINTKAVELIDDEVRQLIFVTRRLTGLPPQTDIQILNVLMTDAFYSEDQTGNLYRHRKICRYLNTINQTVNHS